MKRDMDLIRLLLLQQEGADTVDLSQYEEKQQRYHRALLLDAGLVAGTIDNTVWPDHEDPDNVWPSTGRLTWAGHEFLDAARDETIWNQAKESVKEKVGSTSIEVVIALLKSLAMTALGL